MLPNRSIKELCVLLVEFPCFGTVDCVGLAWLLKACETQLCWFVVCVPLAMCKPAIDPYSGGIMPSSGVAALLRD